MFALSQKQTSEHDWLMSALPPKADIYSQMNHATTGCMGNGVCTSDRIELVDQCTHVKLGGVDRYAKTAHRSVRRHSSSGMVRSIPSPLTSILLLIPDNLRRLGVRGKHR